MGTINRSPKGSHHGRSGRLLAKYFNDLGTVPILTREEEQRLARLWKERESQQYFDELVVANTPFVVSIAREFRDRGLSFEDMIGEGNIGLIEAAKRFDPERDVKFVTFAFWWIRKAISKALNANARLVRRPPYIRKQMASVRKTRQKLALVLGRVPTIEEIASAMNLTTAKVHEYEAFSAVSEISLDEFTNDDSARTLHDIVADTRDDQEQSLLIRADAKLISLAMRALTKQQRQVIELRFGITNERPQTLKQVGYLLRLSRERIRQIEADALIVMRKRIEKRPKPKESKFPKRPGQQKPAPNKGFGKTSQSNQ